MIGGGLLGGAVWGVATELHRQQEQMLNRKQHPELFLSPEEQERIRRRWEMERNAYAPPPDDGVIDMVKGEDGTWERR